MHMKLRVTLQNNRQPTNPAHSGSNQQIERPQSIASMSVANCVRNLWNHALQLRALSAVSKDVLEEMSAIQYPGNFRADGLPVASFNEFRRDYSADTEP